MGINKGVINQVKMSARLWDQSGPFVVDRGRALVSATRVNMHLLYCKRHVAILKQPIRYLLELN